jgi:hypothetical protein
MSNNKEQAKIIKSGSLNIGICRSLISLEIIVNDFEGDVRLQATNGSYVATLKAPDDLKQSADGYEVIRFNNVMSGVNYDCILIPMDSDEEYPCFLDVDISIYERVEG